MPKRPASLKPSSKPFSRRGHSLSSKCNALQRSLPSPTSPSTLPSWPSLSFPPLSPSFPSCSTASFSCTSEILPLDLPKADSSANHSSRSGFSTTVCSSSSSSWSVSPSFASLAVTCLEMAASETSCSISYCHVGHEDVLSEYVKGLQEANKALDVDVAERVLQELADSLTSPAAAALVVSSGGARLIASSVKQFKSHGGQKSSQSKGKVSRPAGKASSSFRNTKTENGIGGGMQDSGSTDACSICLPVEDAGQPMVVGASNEARRKRQRISGELADFEDVKDHSACEIRTGNHDVPLPGGQNGNTCSLVADIKLLNSGKDASNADERCSLSELNNFAVSTMRSCHVSRCCNRHVKGSSAPNSRDMNAEKSDAISIKSPDCICLPSKESFDELSRQDCGNSSVKSCLKMNGNHVNDQEVKDSAQEVVTASCLPKSGVCFTTSSSKKRESAKVPKQGVKVSYGLCRENGKGKTLNTTTNVVAAGIKENEVTKAAGSCTLSDSSKPRTCSETTSRAKVTPNQVAGKYVAGSRVDKVPEDESATSDLLCSDKVRTGAVSEAKVNSSDNAKSMKAKEEKHLGEDKDDFPMSILDLAKEAGLPDVVAAACNALDKLVSAALQGKGASPVMKCAGLVSSSSRRGKPLPAEIYVALTEALVEIVQVLKDQVELLCWSLDCLGSILPPTSRLTCDGAISSGCSSLDSLLSSKELLHVAGCRDNKADSTAAGKQSDLQSMQPLKPSLPILKDEAVSKEAPKSFSGAVASGCTKDACDICPIQGSTGLGSSLCSSISNNTAASSISALAAVAYMATVPMLAEKAVKAVLSAMQPCDIEPHSTQAALCALSAHLSSTNSKYVCDDAIAFIIAAMREFKTDAEMQTKSCMALASLNKAISSATGHCAWSTVIDTMVKHRTNILVQRAGCCALQVLCTRAGLGIPEWGSGKRPLRAAKDTDREGGVGALVSAMLSFPDDVRIQWHGCSALWTLVHSAGVRSVANMVYCGALCAVMGAMLVCRTNETIQQEGCNVIGTMARTLAENGYDFGPQFPSDSERCGTSFKYAEKHSDIDMRHCKTSIHGDHDTEETGLSSADDWWEAMKVVVAAMRAFPKSKSVQSNGIFALGCILKGSVETTHPDSACFHADVSGLPVASKKTFKASPMGTDVDIDASNCKQSLKGSVPMVGGNSSAEQSVAKHAETLACLAKDLIDDIERLNEAVEVTMTAMPEFPKVEMVQLWGCAVLQQAFLAYVHYSKRMRPLSPHGSAIDCRSSQGSKHVAQVASGSTIPSPDSALANLVLSQATSAMFMISGMMALSYSGSSGNGGQQIQEKAGPSTLSRTPAKAKSSGAKSQASTGNQSYVSVRQSWCAALGAIGDVFGYLAQNNEVPIGKSLPSVAGALSVTWLNGASSSNGFLVSGDRSLWMSEQINSHHQETGHQSADDQSWRFCLPPGPTMEQTCIKESKLTASKKASSTNVAHLLRELSAEEDRKREFLHDKHITKKVLKCSEQKQQDLSNAEWTGMDTASQQQVIKDIKAWQEATESLAKIAERVGFPMSVKNAILAIRTVLYKLEDAETVIWACHALVSLYLAWENVHLSKPGLESEGEDFHAKIWGEGDVGVRQLVHLVSHWTKQNRADVTSLALQALYSACVFAAPVREIEEVFAPADCGTEAVLGAMQKALTSTGSVSQRKEVIQQACFLLTVVCSYSIPVQVGFATAGGADIVLASLERYDEDNEVLVNCLQTLGVDFRLQADFDDLWNAAVYRNSPSTGGKGSKKKKSGASSGSVVVGLSQIFKEGAGASSNTEITGSDTSLSNLAATGGDAEMLSKPKWMPQLERLVFGGKGQTGRFLTWLIASPGCGGPSFAVEVLRKLNTKFQSHTSFAEMQAHVCLVIGYMSAHNSKWRQGFLDAGALQAVLACMQGAYSWKGGKPPGYSVVTNGVEKTFCSEQYEPGTESFISQSKSKKGASHNVQKEDKLRDLNMAYNSEAPFQCAACWSLAGLVKDHKGSFPVSINLLIQVLIMALYRYGGLPNLKLLSMRTGKLQSEVCAPSRLALSRLGVSRIGDGKGKQMVHAAAEAGDLTSLEALAKKGVDLTAIDDNGHSPLWYAEQGGHTKVVLFLKGQVQLCGRRKPREKVKAKCKQATGKDELEWPEKDVLESAVTKEQADLSQDVCKIASLTPGQTSHPGLVPISKKLELLNDNCNTVSSTSRQGDHPGHILFGAEDVGMACEEIIAPSSTASSTKSLKVVSPSDNGGPNVPKSGNKKKSKGIRRSQLKDQHLPKDLPSFTAKDSVANSVKPEILTAPTVLTGKIGNSGVLEQINNDNNSKPSMKSGEEAREICVSELSNGQTHVLRTEHLVPDEVAICSETDLKESKLVGCNFAADENGATQTAEQVNQLLREALVSGAVENLQSALELGEKPGSNAEGLLLKKVRAALAKRLKRLEKSVALEEGLSSAVESGTSSQLQAAIMAIEKVPRFATALSEKLAAAKQYLSEIEKQERILKKEESVVSSKCDQLDDVPVYPEDCLTGGIEIASTLRQEGSVLQDVNSSPWMDVCTGRRSKEREAKEDIHTRDSELAQNEIPVARSRSRRSRGRMKVFSAHKHQASGTQGSIVDAAHGTARATKTRGLCPPGNVEPPELVVSAVQQDMPPLLPTPQPPQKFDSFACRIARSVIQPPRQKDHFTSLEHGPITPQLFPAPHGSSLSYSCHDSSYERETNNGRANSVLSRNSVVQQDSESGLLHISQLFPPCSSPQLFSHQNPNPQNPQPSAEFGSFYRGVQGSLLPTILPSHMIGAPVSSFSTFSTLPFNSQQVSLSSHDTEVPHGVHERQETFLPSLNVNAQPFLPTLEPNISTLPAFVQQALSCTCDEDSYEEQLGSPSSPLMVGSPGSCILREAFDDFQTANCELKAIPSKNGLADEGCKLTTGLSSLHHEFHHLSQVHLQQAAVLDASLEDSCCICFDKPKDAALISCGHRMCKGCAEEMHRIRRLCPVCNRIIEAVLALYG